MRKLQVLLVVMVWVVSCGYAQKIKVGYDKSVDFSRYKSYSWQEPGMTQTRPLLYATVTGSIRNEFEAKGLVRMESGGDLTLFAEGGLDYGLNSGSGFMADSCQNCKKPLTDAREWVGESAPPGMSSAPVPKGTLALQLVDRASNKVVWTGSVQQKLDPEKKQQSLQRIDAAIKKLLNEFPPRSK